MVFRCKRKTLIKRYLDVVKVKSALVVVVVWRPIKYKNILSKIVKLYCKRCLKIFWINNMHLLTGHGFKGDMPLSDSSSQLICIPSAVRPGMRVNLVNRYWQKHNLFEKASLYRLGRHSLSGWQFRAVNIHTRDLKGLGVDSPWDKHRLFNYYK